MSAEPSRSTPTAVLAVGGSAGSLTPLLALVRGLPPQFPAAVLVTVHLGDSQNSRLPEILSRRSRLPAAWARDGEPLRPARVYVAPPGFHLVAAADSVSLSRGPRVNRHRPSVDVLFASMASTIGPAGVAVVLSGALDDGAVGVALVAAAGGEVLVEDPDDAEFSGMPLAALHAVTAATTSRADDIARAVDQAVARALDRAAKPTPSPTTAEEADTMAHHLAIDYLAQTKSRLTRMSCPECGGSLAQIDLDQISYFRCHIGHHYGPQTLAAAQADASEAKIWSAVAGLEEEAALQRYLHETAPHASPGTPHLQVAEQLAQRADQLRELAHAWTPLAPDPERDATVLRTNAP